MGNSGKKSAKDKKTGEGLRFPTNVSLILFFLRGSYLYFLAGAVFACLVALFDLIIPRMIQYTVDAVIGGNMGAMPGWAAGIVSWFGGAGFLRGHLWAAALGVSGAAALGAVCRYFFKISNAKGAETFVRRMRDQLFRHILSLPYAWQGENSTGDTIQRCTSDVETIKIFVSEQLTSLLRVFILVFMSLYFMVTIQPKLTIAAAVFIPIMIISSLIFYGLIGNEFEKVDIEEGQLSAIAQENLTGVRVVRTFGREKFERERFEKQNDFYTDHWIRLMRVLAAFWVSGNVIATVRNMTVAVFGAVLCVRDQLTAGGLIAFLSYNALMSLPVRGIGRMIADMSKAGVSLDRLRYIMNAVPEEDESAADAVLAEKPPMDRDIEFSHVSFRYSENSPWILRGLSMKIRAGTTVGILGATGSGKTTLALLLDRLWELPEGCGEISIGGRDIRGIDRGWLRKNIGMVQQEPYLFSRTLMENIAIAMPNPEDGPRKPGAGPGTREKVFAGGTPERGIKPEAESETGAEQDTEMDTNLEFRLESEMEIDLESGPETGMDTDLESEIETEMDADLESESEEWNLGDEFSGEDEEQLDTEETRMREIHRAAGIARLNEAVERFTDGYDTFVGERGVTLSGGQKQRAAIARMLVRRTPIMIFDDSLSAVDAETDAEIRRELRENTSDATVILIAHRITTLQHADEIFVLEDGRVSEHGTHEQLIEKGGHYSRVYALQTGGKVS